MKAIVYSKYGTPDVLQLKEVKKPTPQPNEILIKIKATAVNSGDVRLRKADPFAIRFFFGLFKPKQSILGAVFSGEVESVGNNASLFKIGDQVFGHTDMRFGAYTEYICVKENSSLAIKPATFKHTEAAVIPFGGTTALYFIKKAAIKPGQKVLIVGASGAVGCAAVQLAKYYGANVTGICSTSNLGLVKSLGADEVIDYTKEDFSKNGKIYDVIFDAVNSQPVFKIAKSIQKNGVLVINAAGLAETFEGLYVSATSSRKVYSGMISHTATDIAFLKELMLTGKFKAVIDRTYPMEKIAAAHAYVETGHKKGNVAVEIE